MRSGSLLVLRSVLAGACAVLAAAGCGSPAPDLLLVAPFAENVAPSRDDPDTLRAELRSVVGRLSLVPRNDSGPTQVAAAVLEGDPEILWLRLAQDPAPWLRALPSRWRGLVVHSVALAHRAAGPVHGEITQGGTVGAGRALLRVRPMASDQAAAAYARTLLREWELGATLASANEAAAAALRREPWPLVGDVELTLEDLHSSREGRPSAD